MTDLLSTDDVGALAPAIKKGLQRPVLFDALTGLPGRSLLDTELARAITRNEMSGAHFAYLLCEIDYPELIAAAVGAKELDALMQEIALRLTDALRAGDFIARPTATQFVVLSPDAAASRAALLARDLIEVVEGPIDLAESPIWPSISVGVASTSTVPATTVAGSALSALQRAKRRGPGALHIFDPSDPSTLRAALTESAELRDAVEAGEIALRYQPIVRLATNEVIGAEARLLWDRPGREPAAPQRIIALAEQAMIVGELGKWTLQRACLDAAEWPEHHIVSVNLSRLQLTDDLVDAVAGALDTSAIAPERLWVEIPESVLSTDAPITDDILRRLSDMGVHICLDDFGAGDRAMADLRKLPTDSVKIDAAFIGLLDASPDDTAIGSTLVRLAASLSRPMIADGVETAAQVELLRSLGCEFGQGQLWSHELRVGELPDRIEDIEDHVVPLIDARPEPYAAALVRILELHRLGASPASIAAARNQDGVESPSGGRWRQTAVARLIGNV